MLKSRKWNINRERLVKNRELLTSPNCRNQNHQLFICLKDWRKNLVRQKWKQIFILVDIFHSPNGRFFGNGYRQKCSIRISVIRIRWNKSQCKDSYNSHISHSTMPRDKSFVYFVPFIKWSILIKLTLLNSLKWMNQCSYLNFDKT